MKLYEITAIFREAVFEIEENDGVISTETEAKLNGASLDMAEKCDAICGILAELKAEEVAAKEEARRLSDRAKSRATQAKNLRAYLLHNLEAMGQKRVNTKRWTLSLALGPPKVICEEPPEALPEAYRRVKYEVDKTAIKEALLGGEKLSFAAKLEREKSLRIK